MKCLLISFLPWQPMSNRGMDLIAYALASMGADVHVLKFPTYLMHLMRPQTYQLVHGVIHRVDLPGRIKSSTVVTLGLPYGERYFWWIKWKLIFNTLQKTTLFTLPRVDFSSYEMVVIESGKPLFFTSALEKIPPKSRPAIVYRQSDPIELGVSRNPRFIEKEKQMLAVADLVLMVNEKIQGAYKSHYPKYAHKFELWENGFNIPVEPYATYETEESRAIYFGLFPIDLKVLITVARALPSVTFHIIGPVAGRLTARLIVQKCPNVVFHGFVPQEKALPLIASASVAFLPYHASPRLKFFGLTSKLLLFMHYCLPIVILRQKGMSSLSERGIDMVDTVEDFVYRIRYYTKRRMRKMYHIDLSRYTREERVKELLAILNARSLLGRI